MSQPRLPSYRLHKSSGQAVVTFDGRDHYLGRHNTPESKAGYERLMASWLANGRRLPTPTVECPVVTVADVCATYLKHADNYYRDKHGNPTKEVRSIEDAMKPMALLFAHLPAEEFSPRKLKAVRDRMIEAGLARTTINNQVQRLKRVFKWATEEELITPGVYHGLRAVAGLRRNRTRAPEPRPVEPVERGLVELALPHMPSPVAAMVELQWLTGMRPGEVVLVRTLDIDREGEVWLYRPQRHKTEHHGHERVVPLGPAAQEIIRCWLRADPTAYLFRPIDAEEERNARRRAARRTPMTPSQSQRKRAKNRRRPWSEHYKTESYARAVNHACKKAGIAPWSPNQLRHAAATRLRREIGLEAARVVLGHRSPEVTEIYAEIDRAKAIEVMARHG